MSDAPTHSIAITKDGTETLYTEDQKVRSSYNAASSGQLIFEWCEEHGVDADLLWSGVLYSPEVKSVWGVKDEQQRTLFALRWA